MLSANGQMCAQPQWTLRQRQTLWEWTSESMWAIGRRQTQSQRQARSVWASRHRHTQREEWDKSLCMRQVRNSLALCIQLATHMVSHANSTQTYSVRNIRTRHTLCKQVGTFILKGRKHTRPTRTSILTASQCGKSDSHTYAKWVHNKIHIKWCRKT